MYIYCSAVHSYVYRLQKHRTSGRSSPFHSLVVGFGARSMNEDEVDRISLLRRALEAPHCFDVVYSLARVSKTGRVMCSPDVK